MAVNSGTTRGLKLHGVDPPPPTLSCEAQARMALFTASAISAFSSPMYSFDVPWDHGLTFG